MRVKNVAINPCNGCTERWASESRTCHCDCPKYMTYQIMMMGVKSEREIQYRLQQQQDDSYYKRNKAYLNGKRSHRDRHTMR